MMTSVCITVNHIQYTVIICTLWMLYDEADKYDFGNLEIIGCPLANAHMSEFTCSIVWFYKTPVHLTLKADAWLCDATWGSMWCIGSQPDLKGAKCRRHKYAWYPNMNMCNCQPEMSMCMWKSQLSQLFGKHFFLFFVLQCKLHIDTPTVILSIMSGYCNTIARAASRCCVSPRWYYTCCS